MSERRRFCCRCAVLFSFYFLYGAVFSFFLALYVFWLIFRPHNIQFSVTDASLAKFNLIPTKSNRKLHYNLALNVTVQNHNKHIGVYYARIRAISYYGNDMFAAETLDSTPFYQGRENITVLHPVFIGRRAISFKSGEIEKYNSETSDGIYRIHVKLDLRMRLPYGKIKTGVLKPPMVECVLRVPLRSNGESKMINKTYFEATNCGHVLTSLVLPDRH